MGEWRMEFVFIINNESAAEEEDHALTIADRCSDVVKGASDEVVQAMLTKEF